MSIFSTRSDLALDRDDHAQFLPLLVAFMVFLAIIAMVGVAVVNRTVDRWDTGVRDTLTVQIAPAPSTEASNRAIENAMRIVRDTPGVVSAQLISEAQVLDLLRPWLGALANQADLPLPRLIDVTIDTDESIDVTSLGRRLALAVPGATVDDHRVWLDRLIRLLSTIELIGISVLALITLITIGTVIFTTRTGLAVHRDAIEVLHLIGAQDSYVARQFAMRALWLGLRGGLIGLALAIPTLLGLGHLAQSMQSATIPDISIGLGQWIGMAAMPVFASVIAMMTARITVLRTLSKML
ncbi:MAG: FtsX-like permease family protein [Rhodospirillales bacterium]